MSRRRTYAIIVMAGGLAASLELLMHLIPDSPGAKPWLEHQSWYSPKSLLTAVACLVVASIAVELWRHRSQDAPERAAQDSRYSLDRVLRLRLLDKIQRERVDPRLRQGLRRAIRVDLELMEAPDVVQPKLRAYVASETAAVATQPIEGPIEDIFKQTAGGRLLILGEPGTGKTNLLLELAEGLIAGAKRDEARPIPAVFNLPRWTRGGRARTLAEWLKDDLAAEYGLSRSTADALIAQDRILPLLDGLDEVSEHDRTVCAEAIMAFQKGRDLGSIVICCRTTEYATIPKLELGAAIQVQKLTHADIEREIAKPRLTRVRQALKSDPELWEVIDTPLWLHVLYLAAQVESPSNVQNPRDRLYARYVEYAFGRTAGGSLRKRTAQEPRLCWLGWLAAEMRCRSQSEFALEDLNWSWLDSRSAQRIARRFELLVVSLASVLLLEGGILPGAAVSGRLKDSVTLGVFGILGGLILGPSTLGVARYIAIKHQAFRYAMERPTEELNFAWPDRSRVAPWAYIVPLLYLAFGGLIYALAAGFVFGKATGATTGLAWALLMFTSIGNVAFLQPLPVSGRTSPNSSILRSLRSSLVRILLGTSLMFAATFTHPSFNVFGEK